MHHLNQDTMESVLYIMPGQEAYVEMTRGKLKVSH